MKNLNIRLVRTPSSRSNLVGSILARPLAALLALAPLACDGPRNPRTDANVATAREEGLPFDHKFKSSKEVADYIDGEIKRIVELYKSYQGKPEQQYWHLIPEHLIPRASELLDLNAFVRLGDQGNVTVNDANAMTEGIVDLARQMEKRGDNNGDDQVISKTLELMRRYGLSPRGIVFIADFISENSAQDAERILEFCKGNREVLEHFQDALVAYKRHGIEGLKYLKEISDKYQIPLNDLMLAEWNEHCNQPADRGNNDHEYYKKAEALVKKYRLNNAEANILLSRMDHAFEAGIELYGEERTITTIKFAAIAYDQWSGFENLRFLVEHGDLLEARTIAGDSGNFPLADADTHGFFHVGNKKYISMARQMAELSRDMQIPLNNVLELMQRHGSYVTRVILTIASDHDQELDEDIKDDYRNRGRELNPREMKQAKKSEAENLVERYGVIAMQAMSEDAKLQGKKLREYDREDAKYFASEAMKIGEGTHSVAITTAGNIKQRRDSLEETHSSELTILYEAERERRERNMELNAAVRARYSIVGNPLKFLAYLAGHEPTPEPVQQPKFERSDFVRELFDEYGIEAVELGLYLASQSQGRPAQFREIFRISDQLNAIPVAARFTEHYTAQQLIALFENAPISVFQNGANSEQLIGAVEISKHSLEVYKTASKLAERFRDDSIWRNEVKSETEDGYLIVGGALDHYDIYWTARAIIEFSEANVRSFLDREGRNLPDGETLYRMMKSLGT